VLKTLAAESADNRAVLAEWCSQWSGRAAAALLPVVEQALGSDADTALEAQLAAFRARIEKTGISC